MVPDDMFKLELMTTVGALSPPVIKHVKDQYVKGTGKAPDLQNKILTNFVNYKKEKLALKPSTKEIVAGLMNTLNFLAEYVLFLHGERYDEDIADRFVNQVERAWVLNVKSAVSDNMHQDLLWLQKMRAQCLDEGSKPQASDMVLFENKVKHYLRDFKPGNLPK
nr:hypothetical protein [Candidatus Sigynarchaeota archaeon]